MHIFGVIWRISETFKHNKCANFIYLINLLCQCTYMRVGWICSSSSSSSSALHHVFSASSQITAACRYNGTTADDQPRRITIIMHIQCFAILFGKAYASINVISLILLCMYIPVSVCALCLYIWNWMFCIAHLFDGIYLLWLQCALSSEFVYEPCHMHYLHYIYMGIHVFTQCIDKNIYIFVCRYWTLAWMDIK